MLSAGGIPVLLWVASRMIGFLIRRVLQAIIVILGVVLIVFLLGKLIPGGEAAAALGPRRSPAQVAHFNLVNGLDLPIYDQFWRYIWGLFHLNLGVLLQEQRGRQGADRAAVAEDADPGRRVDPGGTRHRGAARHPAGRAVATSHQSTTPDLAVIPLLRHAALLPGLPAHPLLLLRPPPLPGVATHQQRGAGPSSPILEPSSCR